MGIHSLCYCSCLWTVSSSSTIRFCPPIFFPSFLHSSVMHTWSHLTQWYLKNSSSPLQLCGSSSITPYTMLWKLTLCTNNKQTSLLWWRVSYFPPLPSQIPILNLQLLMLHFHIGSSWNFNVILWLFLWILLIGGTPFLWKRHTYTCPLFGWSLV